MNTEHLDALNLRLSHERERLAKAKKTQEQELRKVWVAQIDREIAAERKFLGLTDDSVEEMSDAELLSELGV